MIYKTQSLVIVIYKDTIPKNKIIPNLNKPGKTMAHAKNMAPGKTIVHAKNMAPGTTIAHAKNMKPGKTMAPYCLGSAEYAAADISLVPLMSTFSSLLIMNLEHVVSK
jgi:hypothetical protein